MKNTKRLHQFGQFLVHSPNSNENYTVGIKDNAEDGKIIDGKFDNNFFAPKSNAYNYQIAFEALPEYGSDDIDWILHELRDQQHETYQQGNLKKMFFVNYDCERTPLERPRIYFNYGYADNITLSSNQKDSESEYKIGASLRMLKPFFFECDRDLGILDPKLLEGRQIYNYDYNAYYDSSPVYDYLQSVIINPNNQILTVYDLKKYFECCQNQKYLIYYKDFFNIANLDKREVTTSINQRRDNMTLVVPLNSSSIIYTNTDRSRIILPNPAYPTGWTGGNLDLNTSRKSEVMVIELDDVVPQNYSIKIKNEDNKSYIKLTWLASTGGGQTKNLQIYPHLGKVYADGILANPLTDYTIEVDERYGNIYFDSLYRNPQYPAQLSQQVGQNITIEQSTTITNTLYIQTLKTFY